MKFSELICYKLKAANSKLIHVPLTLAGCSKNIIQSEVFNLSFIFVSICFSFEVYL